MIVKMKKVFIAAAGSDQGRLIDTLGQLGVLHIAPVQPQQAVVEDAIRTRVDQLQTALQRLSPLKPGGSPPEVDALQAAQETLQIIRRSAENAGKLNTLHQQVEKLGLWGNVRLEQFQQLEQAGLTLTFVSVPTRLIPDIKATYVQPLAVLGGKKSLVAVVRQKDSPITLPDPVEIMERPKQDRPTLVAEARHLEQALKADHERLAQLAHLTEPMKQELARQQVLAQASLAGHSGLAQDRLYALQGWVPADKTDHLAAGLSQHGLTAAIHATEPTDTDEPPTLIHYPRWVRPIKGLFDILGTVPGYREFDISWVFMIALPIFAAILISDAGYGLVYLLLPLLYYKKLARKTGPELPQLLMTIGAVSVAWGIISMSFFGFGLADLEKLGPTGVKIANLLRPLFLVKVDVSDPAARDLLMRISFTLGMIQLVTAHLLKVIAAFPHLRMLSSVGWGVFLVGMFGLVKMFVLNDPFTGTIYPWLLGVGAALAIIFAEPNCNIAKMLGLGLANFPLSAIGSFGDTVSYVRLMAVGLAGSALAVAFNEMGSKVGLAFVVVFLLGHSLNVALSIVSLFAHGVRLNMLEFSNNLGMQWSGYSYEPFLMDSNRKET